MLVHEFFQGLSLTTIPPRHRVDPVSCSLRISQNTEDSNIGITEAQRKIFHEEYDFSTEARAEQDDACHGDATVLTL